MNPSENTSSVINTPSVPDIEIGDDHTKDTKDGVTAIVATPEQNISNLDHEAVLAFVGDQSLNVDNVRAENVTANVERILEQKIKELLLRLEIEDGKNVRRRDDKLIQAALTICAQLGPVFVASFLNKSSCSCAASPSPPSHSDFARGITDTVTGLSLIGFISSLIGISFENQKSPPPKRQWTISSVAAKLGLAAASSAIIVSTGAALPLGINGNLAVTAAISLPALVAVAVS